jgi:hypothetical protein
MKRAVILLLGALSLAALAGFGSAQTYVAFRDEWDQVRKAKLHFGPFSIIPSLALRDIGYDDNVYFESAARGDYTATIAPEARIYWPLGSWILLSARDTPEYSFYLREKNRREFSNSYGFAAKALLFGRVAVTGGLDHDKRRRPLSSEIGSLVTDETRAVNAGLAIETARKTSLAVAVFRREVAIEDFGPAGGASLSSAFNRKEKGLTLEFHYPVSSETFFFLSGGYTEYAFALAGSAWRDSTSVAVSGGLRFPLTGRISGLLALGYKKFTIKSGPYPGFTGLTGNTELDGRFGRFGVRLRYRRDNPFSFYQNVVYFIENDYGAGVSVYLTSFLRLDYNFDYGLGDYPRFFVNDPATGLDEAVRRRDRHYTHSVGLVYRIFTDTGFGLTWNEIRWISTLPGWDRQRRFIGATLTQRF